MKLVKLLRESQFHGGRRLAERKCRCFWYISMVLLFGSAVTVICLTVQRFFDNPTYMVQLESVANTTMFPSVIVCPEIFYSKKSIDSFLANIRIPPHLNASYLRMNIYVLAAHYSPDLVYRTRDLLAVEELLEYNNLSVEAAARILTTSCDDALLKCRWQGVIQNCSELFEMELTGDGYCCVFNGRSIKRKLHNGHMKPPHYKYVTNHYGFGSGLMVAVNGSQFVSSIDLSYKWLGILTGQHYVDSSVNGTALSPGSEYWVEYQQRHFQIGEEARGLSNSLRKCRMADDALEFFPVYTREYCGVECEVSHTMKRCGCIRLVHPRPHGAPLCTARQLLCAKHAMVSFDSELCDCPMACDVSKDEVKVSEFMMDSNVPYLDTFYDGLNLKSTSVVRVFTINSLVKTDIRWSYFSRFDLFSQLGGVFNVFFGCSILTLLEILILVCRGLAQTYLSQTNV